MTIPAERVVDARGLRCPMPVIELARVMAHVVSTEPDITRVVVLATDPAAVHDIPAWCRMRGHHYVGATEGPDHVAHTVEVVRVPSTD